jgi:hypothetical protein
MVDEFTFSNVPQNTVKGNTGGMYVAFWTKGMRSQLVVCIAMPRIVGETKLSGRQ